MVALHFLFCSSCVRRHCIAGGRMGWIEAFVPGQYGPEDASVLVGNRDQRLIVANTRMQLDDPAREPVIASVRCENGRSRALEQERAQVVAALLMIRPSRCLPPLLFCLGTRPIQAAICRPFLN